MYKSYNGEGSEIAVLDNNEVNAIIAKYGPVIYLHPDEQYLLDSVECYLDNSYLECGPVVIKGNNDEEEYNNFQIELRESVKTSSGSLLSDLAYIKNKYAREFQENPYFKYWLNIDDQFIYGNMSHAKIYVAVYDRDFGHTDIQFYFFYPYNGPAKIQIRMGSKKIVKYFLDPVGRHIGDAEHVTLRICNSTGRPEGVYMSRHSGGEWVYGDDIWTRLELEDTHPVIYSAKDSHAHYTSEGDKCYNNFWSRDFRRGTVAVDLMDTCGKGLKFETWLPGKYQIITQEKPDWLKFKGRWGPAEKLCKTLSFNYFKGNFTYTCKEVGNGTSFNVNNSD